MENNPNPVTPTQKKSTGSIIGIIIIVFLFVVGGLYFWGKKLINDSQNNSLPATSVSDETSAIEKDTAADLKSVTDINLDDLESTLK